MDTWEIEWEKIYGKQFIEKIGVKYGDTVIDFGCHEGRYSIVLAQVVGDSGIVYAIDKDNAPIRKLRQKIRNTEYDDIIQIIHSNRIPDSVYEESIDFFLLYDVLHYLNQKQRVQTYRAIFPILKSETGVLSLHPKHTKDDVFPFWNFKDLTIKDVVMEVEEFGFHYKEKIQGLLVHRDNFEYSSIYNFVKKTM
ncbi:MAG: methyltransferase domain-containing protein [Candidatus Lokiarchaeota archaeon]|nr:methyltransferase domain-containing protein [Candidatus Lokiarchaeota archaeon]